METTTETATEWAGCGGHACPLAARFMENEQRTRRLEQRFQDHFTRLHQLCSHAMSELMEMALLPATHSPQTGQEETVRGCLARLMEERDATGHYLFRCKSHWQAVYRILADHGLGVADGDYRGFERLVQWIAPSPCRVPFSLHALKHIANTNFTRPFSKWRYDPTYFQKRKPYDDMVAVARRFEELLAEQGL